MVVFCLVVSVCGCFSSEFDRKYELLINKAKQGDVKAQNNLGKVFYEEAQNSQDYSQALEWFRQAAEQGYTESQFYMGKMYSKGNGVTQDHKIANEWYVKACDKDNGKACNNLAVMYIKGNGVTKSIDKAIDLYMKASLNGSSTADINLAGIYRNTGIKQDYLKAQNWYKKALDKNDPNAQNELSFIENEIEESCIKAVTNACQYDGNCKEEKYLAKVKNIDDKMLIGDIAGDEVIGHLCKVNGGNVEVQMVRLLRGIDTSGYRVRTYSINTGKRIEQNAYDYAETAISFLNNKPNGQYSNLKIIASPVQVRDVIMLYAQGFYNDPHSGDIPVQLSLEYNIKTNNISYSH